MILSREELEPLKMAELRGIVASLELDPVQPNETKAEVIQRLLLEAAKEPETVMDVPAEEAENSLPAQCTIEEVKKAVNPYILRGMKVFYDRKTNCWLFRVQLKSYAVRDTNTGETRLIERWRDDSGTLNQSLEVIKRCARVLMQGAPSPEFVKPQRSIPDSYESVA